MDTPFVRLPEPDVDGLAPVPRDAVPVFAALPKHAACGAGARARSAGIDPPLCLIPSVDHRAARPTE